MAPPQPSPGATCFVQRTLLGGSLKKIAKYVISDSCRPVICSTSEITLFSTCSHYPSGGLVYYHMVFLFFKALVVSVPRWLPGPGCPSTRFGLARISALPIPPGEFAVLVIRFWSLGCSAFLLREQVIVRVGTVHPIVAGPLHVRAQSTGVVDGLAVNAVERESICFSNAIGFCK